MYEDAIVMLEGTESIDLPYFEHFIYSFYSFLQLANTVLCPAASDRSVQSLSLTIYFLGEFAIFIFRQSD